MRAVAATLASVAVFVSLLVSNLLLYYSESQRLSMTNLATLESEEGVIGTVVISQNVYRVLALVQQNLVQNPPRCSSWEQYAASLATSSAYTGDVRAVRYNLAVNASVAGAGSEADNLTLLGPFDGSNPGSLNLAVRIHLNESAGGLPTYAVSESHVVHLPIALSSSLSLCRGFMSEIQRSVSRVSCARMPSLSRVDELAGSYSRLAVSSGLSFAFSRWFVKADGCWMFFYAFTLSQDSVQGVSGAFGWHISDSGFA